MKLLLCRLHSNKNFVVITLNWFLYWFYLVSLFSLSPGPSKSWWRSRAFVVQMKFKRFYYIQFIQYIFLYLEIIFVAEADQRVVYWLQDFVCCPNWVRCTSRTRIRMSCNWAKWTMTKVCSTSFLMQSDLKSVSFDKNTWKDIWCFIYALSQVLQVILWLKIFSQYAKSVEQGIRLYSSRNLYRFPTQWRDIKMDLPVELASLLPAATIND